MGQVILYLTVMAGLYVLVAFQFGLDEVARKGSAEFSRGFSEPQQVALEPAAGTSVIPQDRAE